MNPVARILFDEAHSEAWTVREVLAAAMQPAHPGDASYARAAAALAAAGFGLEVNAEPPLLAERLAGYDALVIAHPSDPAWERTTGTGSPRLSPEEIDAIEAFVAAGGGLIVLGETEQDKYGNNLNELLERFGLRLRNDTVQDYEHNLGAPSWVLAELTGGERGRDGDVLAGVARACLYRATTIECRNGARVLARTHATASSPQAPLIASTRHGGGRVIVLADSDLFGDDCLDALDHRALWLNAVGWVARRVGAAPARAPELGGAWERLRDETDALALLQGPDGALAEGSDPAEHPAARANPTEPPAPRTDPDEHPAVRDAAARDAAAHVEAIAAALTELAPRFPHQAEYLRRAVADLRRWAGEGFGKPDFTAALDAFRPERERRDGAEHLVFLPMYKQNGSRDTCFEALVIRTPWPEWIAELERGWRGFRYDNPKFVPVQRLDSTRGYDGDCAVLFPETVSVAGRPANHFGAIFCDREAARLRRVVGAAAEVLGLNLPPDCARMLTSPDISEPAYILWDLIHDRAHSHGELPFDPFMIRQRAPYWMYALEELRCDLTAFTQARELEAAGLGFARHVQYAILLDRLLRFPVTGTRVRNYDGLGGQLLFAHLHRLGHVRWEDNRLTIDWSRVGDGVAALFAEVGELYRAGIDRTKLGHWAAAHDLVAARVPPAAASRWTAGVRTLDDGADSRSYLDQVLPDEFPLSIFYASLQAKLAA